MANSPLSEALRLAQYGIRVIPLHAPVGDECTCGKDCGRSRGKHPVWKDWAQKATADEEEIKKIWSSTPYNVGVPMGSVNGMFALDIDGDEGMQTLLAWIDEYDDLPATWEVQTGGGGKQYWYRIPEGMEIPNSVKSIGVNVDLRGEGGQSVAPGSLHRSGKRYEWAPGRSFEEMEIGKAPQWLLDKIQEVIDKQKEAKSMGVDLDSIQIQITKHITLNREKIATLGKKSDKFDDIMMGLRTFSSSSERDLAMANQAALHGWDAQEIADLLVGVRVECGEDLKHPTYYKLTVGKALSWAEQHKKEKSILEVVEEPSEEEMMPLPEKTKVMEFPLDVFPDPIRDFIQEVSESIISPPDFMGVHILTLAGAAIGKSYEIEFKPGYRQLPALYSVVIGNAGTAKSPTLEKVFSAFANIQAAKKENYDFRREEYDLRYQEYVSELDQWKKTKKKSEDEKPREPALPILEEIYTTQATTEAVFKMLKRKPRGIVVKLDELSSLMKGMNQYKGGRGDDKEHYLSCWANADVKINRAREEEPTIIHRPFLAITGNITPTSLPKLEGSKDDEDGFIDRFLISYPDDQPIAGWSWKGISETIMSNYYRVIQDLYHLRPRFFENGMMLPNTIYLDGNAKFKFNEWNQRHTEERRDPEFPRRLHGPYAKMDNQVARMALIIHMLRHICGNVSDAYVDGTSMERATRLAEYFKSHMRKVYPQLRETFEDRRIEDAIDWIKRQGGNVKTRDIQKNNVAGCKKATDVAWLISELKDRGYGSVKEVTPPNGGRKAKIFSLHSS